MSLLQQAEAEEYWRDREYKKWVVHIGHRRHGTKTTYVRARTEAKAIAAAKYHLRMPASSHATTRLAHPQYDLGGTRK